MLLRFSRLGLPVSLVVTAIFGCFTRPLPVMASHLVEQPQVGTIVSLETSNSRCYVTLVDEKGIEYEGIPAVFTVCEKQEIFLNQKVALAYTQVPIHDCPSATDCNSTKLFTFITQMWLKLPA
ncbi:MAG TPA: hypothetical protein V6C95_12975 [Coleofasciculaceae cyanobacterium]